MHNRKYMIIPSTEVKKISFNDIMETDLSTLVYSGDGKRTFIKWVGDEPSFISNIKNAQGPYTRTEILEIIRSDDWISPTGKRSNKKVT